MNISIKTETRTKIYNSLVDRVSIKICDDIRPRSSRNITCVKIIHSIKQLSL